MPATQNGCAVFDVTDPGDVQALVNAGVAWSSGPKTVEAILALVTGGRVQRWPDKEPPEVRAYLDKAMPKRRRR